MKNDIYKTTPKIKKADNIYKGLPSPTKPIEKVKIINQRKVEFPDIQKVFIENLPETVEVQKVFINNLPDPIDVQKVIIENQIEFPEIQKVEISNPEDIKTEVIFPEQQHVFIDNQIKIPKITFPEVQTVKVQNQLKLPLGVGNIPGKADPEGYVNVRLTDGKKFYKAIDEIWAAMPRGNPLPAASTGGGGGSTPTGFNMPVFDYVGRALTNPTTVTFTYKTGGASGTTVAVIVIVYADSTLSTLVSATRTL